MRLRIFLTNIIFFLNLIILGHPIFSQENISNSEKNRPSVALVLGGGGVKGFGIIPILEVIDELGIPIDMVIGNSAGAIIGGLYCIGYTPEEIGKTIININWAKIFSDNPNSPLDSLLEGRNSKSSPITFTFGENFSVEIGGNLSTGQNAYLLFKDLSVKIPSYIDFDSLPTPFRATTVNLATGKLELLEEGDIAEAIRSSMSIPGVFQPFPLNGNLYVDGFVQNNLPIQQAKDMGYDIIIAVSLDDPLVGNAEEFNKNPLTTLSQVLLITTSSGNEEQLQLADLVIHPPVEEFNGMDFQKAVEVYEKSKKEKGKYRDELKKILPKIFPEKFQISSEDLQTQRTFSTQAQQSISTHDNFNIMQNNFSFTPLQSLQNKKVGDYSKIPYLVPQELIVFGAVKSDIPYIQSVFEKIKGSILTPDKLRFLVESVYTTGNYTLVKSRVDVRPLKTVLELNLHQVEKENWLILPNVNFAGTLTDDSIAKLSLSLDIQFRGLTGMGSVISLKSIMINDFGASVFYLQPLTPNNYIQLSATGFLDQEVITSGFTSRKITANKISYANIDLLWGIRFNGSHKLQAGGSIYWLNTNEVFTPELNVQRSLYPDIYAKVAAPLSFRYTFNTFDFATFPTRGLFVRLDTTTVFPIMGVNTPVAFNMTKLDFTATIPLAPKFTLVVNSLSAIDPTLQLQKIPDFIPFFGISLGDRMFFPNISGKQQYGTQKFALQVVFQFQPWENISIMGGQVFFNVTGTAGIITMNHKDFSKKNVNWNASFGTGLRINDAFSIMVRGGVGTTHQKIMPFVSLDIGNIRY